MIGSKSLRTGTLGGDSSENVDLEAKKQVVEQHRLSSIKAGQSQVEQVAERIETRRANRIPITSAIRLRLLADCREIAVSKGYERCYITLADLTKYRDRVAEEVANDKNPFNGPLKACGFHHESETLLKVLDKAIEVVREVQMDDDDLFHYQDFNFYYTEVESRWPWARSEVSRAVIIVFFYYFFTPILFCHIAVTNNICVQDGASYAGWMSSLYFASVTLSTVGYGDISVRPEESPRWLVFIGAAYMIVSVVVAVLAFSAAADSAFSPLGDLWEKFIEQTIGPPDPDAFLYQLRRIRAIRLGEIAVQFFALNLLGVLVSRAFLEKGEWTWMDSFYWAVQTTTTIGYGDITPMPFSLRWFQILYLTLSTYFVGSCLGKLGTIINWLKLNWDD